MKKRRVFSEHLVWFGISIALIAGGYFACLVKKPSIEKTLKVRFGGGLESEVVKTLTVMNLLPIIAHAAPADVPPRRSRCAKANPHAD